MQRCIALSAALLMLSASGSLHAQDTPDTTRADAVVFTARSAVRLCEHIVRIRGGTVRNTHDVDVFGRSVRFIADGRDVFAAHRSSRVPDSFVQGFVDANRELLGGGTMMDNIDLSTLDPDTGIRNVVDLAALRGAERRFGNGDGMFDADEQNRAFSAAMQFIMKPHGDSVGTLRLGVEVMF